jgi:hypothetical protein
MSSILEQIPQPRHRGPFPGEIVVGVGRPTGVTIRLLHGDTRAGTVTVPRSGPCRLVGRFGAPVMIRAGGPVVHGLIKPPGLADLAPFTGTALARECLAHVRGIIADDPRQRDWACRVVRFRDPAAYNDLISSLAARYLGTNREDTLLALWTDVEENYGPQADWYAANGAGEGESLAAYKAEAAEFGTLTARWMRATRTQLAAVRPGRLTAERSMEPRAQNVLVRPEDPADALAAQRASEDSSCARTTGGRVDHR